MESGINITMGQKKHSQRDVGMLQDVQTFPRALTAQEIEKSYKKRERSVSRAIGQSNSSAAITRTSTTWDHEGMWFMIRRERRTFHKVLCISDSATSTHCGRIVGNFDAMFPREAFESDIVKQEKDVCPECSEMMEPIAQIE